MTLPVEIKHETRNKLLNFMLVSVVVLFVLGITQVVLTVRNQQSTDELARLAKTVACQNQYAAIANAKVNDLIVVIAEGILLNAEEIDPATRKELIESIAVSKKAAASYDLATSQAFNEPDSFLNKNCPPKNPEGT